LIAKPKLYSTGWSRPLGLIANQNAIFHGVEQAFRPDCKTKTLYSTGWSRPLGLIANQNAIFHGVEQAFRPALKYSKQAALAAEV
jgi:3-oxoacyl-ACP reductase-like protein